MKTLEEAVALAHKVGPGGGGQARGPGPPGDLHAALISQPYVDIPSSALVRMIEVGLKEEARGRVLRVRVVLAHPRGIFHCCSPLPRTRDQVVH